MKMQCPCCGQHLNADSPQAMIALLPMTRMQRRMATILAQQFGQCVSLDQLAERLGTTRNTIKTHMTYVRQAIYPTELKIETHRPDGYRMSFMENRRAA